MGIQGRGYWSGRPVKVEFHPAPPHAGIHFVRVDLSPFARIPAHVQYRVDSRRRTVLEKGTWRVEMVEHVLAALAGLHIDNCDVHVNSSEMPAGDGSSIEVARAVMEAGFIVQGATQPCISVDQHCRVGDGNSWIEARPATSHGLRIAFRLDYSHVIGIGQQDYSLLITPTHFVRDIAPARTFVLEQEALHFQAQGFGKHISYHDLLVFGKTGPINNALRFPDECVRHKILDLVGDLALAGCDLCADIRAHRSGHQLNAMLVEAIQKAHPRPSLKATA